jgi:hypothetical protein
MRTHLSPLLSLVAIVLSAAALLTRPGAVALATPTTIQAQRFELDGLPLLVPGRP